MPDCKLAQNSNGVCWIWELLIKLIVFKERAFATCPATWREAGRELQKKCLLQFKLQSVISDASLSTNSIRVRRKELFTLRVLNGAHA